MKNEATNPMFSEATKAIQQERGSRAAYARLEAQGAFESRVTPDLVQLLAQFDTAFLATASADGQPYVQHRGGAKGFVRKIDDGTIGFAELVGNRQYISAGNLSENDRVCLLLIDYAQRLRLKVWGRARIVPLDAALTERLGPVAKRTDGALLISVAAWDVNCPQHIPQKLDVADVEPLVSSLRARIAELERENKRLRRTQSASAEAAREP